MRNNIIASAVLAASLSVGIVNAAEVTGKVTHESASFRNSGVSIGNNTSITPLTYTKNNVSHGSDGFKSATSARIYVDGELDELSEGSTYHIELQAFNDSDAINTFDGNESYTQRDAFREGYIDTSYDDWLIRAGKQQAVWGTADGIKLLDGINPTDYSEFTQNSIEDSRIPVWMLNADKTLQDGGNFQIIVSEHKANFIPGMSNESATAATVHTNSDKGHPFIMKGVDTITGRTNGFLNIAPDIGAVAQVFNSGFGPLKNNGFTLSTVGEFYLNKVPAFTGGGVFGNGANCSGDNDASTSDPTSAACMAAFIRNASATTNVQNTSKIDGSKNTDNEAGTQPDSAFAYMTDSTFATFQSFSGAKSRYIVEHDDDAVPNIGLRYKNTSQDGVNYSFNFMNKEDANPYVKVNWEAAGGWVLPQRITSATGDGNGTGGNADANGRKYYTVSLPDDYGWSSGNAQGGAPILTFRERLNRVSAVGGSFDSTIDSEVLGPVVLRGEALYTKDEMKPVIDRNKLSYGDLPGALTMQKSDTFKYVLGADITAFTNMLISGQFIQMINLDYVDKKVDADGNACGVKVNCGIYTGDMAAMHLSNGLQKDDEFKEFYSIYLSKPFGESGQHRWNNIFMYENTDDGAGGIWNRFDVEYTVDDNTQLTAEVNTYRGDENTQFGQMVNSSNVQVGLKYVF